MKRVTGVIILFVASLGIIIWTVFGIHSLDSTYSDWELWYGWSFVAYPFAAACLHYIFSTHFWKRDEIKDIEREIKLLKKSLERKKLIKEINDD